MWFERQEAWTAQADDAREPTDVDYARIIHSASFRRLQGKTQILNLGDGDFYRTRLTHSLEVAQIAAGIVRQFEKHWADHPAFGYLPSRSLIQAVAFTHDLGHPPFGHGGEVALNYCMRDNGGFEGNGQTLRILSKLEKFSSNAGANLTRRALLGVLKYPIPYSKARNPELRPKPDPRPTFISVLDRKASKPPKCYLDSEEDVVDWILKPLSNEDKSVFCALSQQSDDHHKALHKSFDSSIMDLADDIGFGVHDLEDALTLGFISEGEFREHVPEEKCSSFLDSLKARYPAEFGNNVYDTFVLSLFRDGSQRKRTIGRMVHYLISSCKIGTIEKLKESLIRYRAMLDEGPLTFLSALKAIVRKLEILSPRVQQLEFKGQKMIISVFEAFVTDPAAFLPKHVMESHKQSGDPMRVICDYVAGMTDNFLLKTYDRLFSPRMGSIFDKF